MEVWRKANFPHILALIRLAITETRIYLRAADGRPRHCINSAEQS